MRLFPREEKFFDLLEAHIEHSVEAARLLHEGLRMGPSAMPQVAGEIKRIEHEGDRITHQLFTRLNQTFVTPLDPEDLHNLGSALDDVLDIIEDAAFRISAYRIDKIPAGVLEQASIIHDCCKTLQTAVGRLKNNQPMLDECIEINRLENAADDAVRALVSDLFANETDAIRLVKYKEIYETLESATDRCEDVADILQTVVVKNS
ncbi:MAG: hypothetical protein JWN34_437 [Bryobacterales bacterium]|nr:hypothetical protein [Bryobacterales bacterium]